MSGGQERFAPLLSPLSAEEMEGRVRRMGEALLVWYGQEARDLPWRRTRDPYRIWLSEIMLQQTRVETVIPYYERFLQALPDMKALAEAPEEQLHKLWEGLGYYSRVRNLQKAARQAMEQYGGRLPETYDELLNLCGIGDYTAGAVASIAFGQPVPAVDGNVLRVLSRLLAAEGDILSPAVKRSVRTLLLEQMPPQPGAFNQALMDLGATICLPGGDPRCGSCPIRSDCLAADRGQQLAFPVKKQKKPRRVEERTVFLLRDEAGRVLLHRRPDEGLLAGLWEFPHTEGTLSRSEADALLRKRGIVPLQLLSLRPAKHIFTHIEWRMSGYLICCGGLEPGEDEVLATGQQRREVYTLSSAFAAFQKVLDQMEGSAEDGNNQEADGPCLF